MLKKIHMLGCCHGDIREVVTFEVVTLCLMEFRVISGRFFDRSLVLASTILQI